MFRKPPRQWTAGQIVDLRRRAYVNDSTGWTKTTAVLLHVPARLIPRKIHRMQQEQQRMPWPEYQWWGFQWDTGLVENAAMGDDPVEGIRAFGAYADEVTAARTAQEWAQDACEGGVTEIPVNQLPRFTKTLLVYAVRRGPGRFGLSP